MSVVRNTWKHLGARLSYQAMCCLYEFSAKNYYQKPVPVLTNILYQMLRKILFVVNKAARASRLTDTYETWTVTWPKLLAFVTGQLERPTKSIVYSGVNVFDFFPSNTVTQESLRCIVHENLRCVHAWWVFRPLSSYRWWDQRNILQKFIRAQRLADKLLGYW